jgi:hypothetical protein
MYMYGRVSNACIQRIPYKLRATCTFSDKYRFTRFLGLRNPVDKYEASLVLYILVARIPQHCSAACHDRPIWSSEAVLRCRVRPCGWSIEICHYPVRKSVSQTRLQGHLCDWGARHCVRTILTTFYHMHHLIPLGIWSRVSCIESQCASIYDTYTTCIQQHFHYCTCRYSRNQIKFM